MMGPINYTAAFGQQGSPFGSIMGGLEAGAQFGKIEQERREQTQQMEAQQAKQTRLNELRAKPFDQLTREEMLEMSELATSPEARKMLAAQVEAMPQEQRAATARTYGEITAALSSSNPEVGIAKLEQLVTAERNPERRRSFEAILEAAKVSPEAAADFALSMMRMGGKEFSDVADSILNQRRQTAQDTRAAEKHQRAIDEADIKLKRLDAIQEAELRKATSDAERARVEARFATARQQAELARSAAQTALAQAQTQQTTAATDRAARQEAQGPAPIFNAEMQGFVLPPSPQNPQGRFIPVSEIPQQRDQAAALKVLQTAGYNPETGEDRISQLIAKSTSGGKEMVLTEVARFFNRTTEGRVALKELEATANDMTLAMMNNRLGAGVSNADREFMLARLGDIANGFAPAEERLQAWGEFKERMLLTGMVPPPKRPGAGGRGGPSGSVDTSNPLLR